MYLKFQTDLDFPILAKRLAPEMPEDSLHWDSENVYEWMYLDLPQLDFSLNVSREHGFADVDEDLLALYEENEAELKNLIKPGPVYVFGWSKHKNDYVDTLPDSLMPYIANRLAVDVFVYDRRINIDLPDPPPIKIVKPTQGTDLP